MSNLNKESILNPTDSGFPDDLDITSISCGDAGSAGIEGWGGDIKVAKPDN